MMSVTPSYRTLVLEQLQRVVPAVRGRSMFGGVGIYSGEFFFALIDDDTLYFKADVSNRPDFEAAGMKAFQPGGPMGEVMQYYEVPTEVFDDVESLGAWVEKAVAVARRAKGKRARWGRG